MKAREWVASFLVSRLELVRALDKAKRGEAEARKELHVRESAWNALRAQLQRSAYQTNRIIRALEVENARLHTELVKVREERDLANDDVYEVVTTGKLPDRPGRAA